MRAPPRGGPGPNRTKLTAGSTVSGFRCAPHGPPCGMPTLSVIPGARAYSRAPERRSPPGMPPAAGKGRVPSRTHPIAWDPMACSGRGRGRRRSPAGHRRANADRPSRGVSGERGGVRVPVCAARPSVRHADVVRHSPGAPAARGHRIGGAAAGNAADRRGAPDRDSQGPCPRAAGAPLPEARLPVTGNRSPATER